MDRTRAVNRMRCFVAILALGLLAGVGRSAPLPDGEERRTGGLELVPPDAPGFATVNVSQVLNSNDAKELLKKLDAKRPDWKKGITGGLGMQLEDVERVTLVFQVPFGEEPLVIFRTVKPVDQKAVRDGLVAGAEEKTLKGKKYYKTRRDALTFVGDRVVVFSTSKAIEAFLERPAPNTGKAEAFLDQARLVAAKQPVVIAVNLARYGKEMQQGLPPDAKGLEPLFAAKAGLLTLVGGDDTSVDLRLTFAGADQAKEGAQAAQAMLDLFGKFVTMGQEALAQQAKNPRTDEFAKWGIEQATQILEATGNALKTARPLQKEQSLTASGRAKVSAGKLVGIVGSWVFVRSAPIAPPPPPPQKDRAAP